MVMIVLILVSLILLVKGSGEDKSTSSANYHAIHGTHILTEGCQDAQKTKTHLFEESISALFDGNLSEAGKQLTFLSLLNLSECSNAAITAKAPVTIAKPSSYNNSTRYNNDYSDTAVDTNRSAPLAFPAD